MAATMHTRSVKGTPVWCHCACLFGLACLFAMSASAGSTEAPKMRLWVYMIYPPSYTLETISPFVSHLEQATSQSFRIEGSNTFERLLNSCEKRGPELVIGPLAVGQQLASECEYTMVAQTQQTVFLYSPDPEFGVDSVRRVGLLKNTVAASSAESLLRERNPDIEFVYYSTFYDMLGNDRQDRLDAIVVATSFMDLAEHLREGWQAIHEFDNKGVAVVMITGRLAPGKVDRIADVFLANAPVVVDVFQKRFGLGRFVSTRYQE